VPDAHAHLALLAEPERVVERAAAAGVGPIVAVSMDARDSEATLRLRERHPGLVLAAIGLHPSRVTELGPGEARAQFRMIESLAASADCIGEVGLDYKDARTQEERAVQQELLALQLDLARRVRKPVNLHTRRADRELLQTAEEFRRESGCGALLHWFTHSMKLARRAAEAGCLVSCGPSVLLTRPLPSESAAGAAPGGPSSLDVAASVPPGALLVETDTPVEYGPLGAAEPSWARRVLEAIAARMSLQSGADAERVAAALAASVAENLERWRLSPDRSAGPAAERPFPRGPS